MTFEASSDEANLRETTFANRCARQCLTLNKPLSSGGAALPAVSLRVMVVPKEQRPLIRNTGSAAVTSIDSKPIGSELDPTAYPKLLDIQGSRVLAQSLAYLPDLRQNGATNNQQCAAIHCLYRRFTLVHTSLMSQSAEPGPRPRTTPHTLRTGPRVALQEQQRHPACLL